VTKVTKIVLIATTLAFVGCGGGGGDNASFGNSSSGVAVASCTLPLASWTTVSSGDAVSADVGAQLQFDHDSSGNKKVCVLAGTAQIL
jgi:hypothetical protein